MELLQIIIFSVKIFALVTAVIVLSSYLMYKVKDKKRMKPYINIPLQQLASEPAMPELQFLQQPYENPQPVNQPVENMQYYNLKYEAPAYENVQYQDEQYVNQQMAINQNYPPRSFGQRFKILNEDNNSNPRRAHVIEKLQPAIAPAQKFNTNRQSQVFNIYDYYGNNSEPMHKIKL